MRKPIVAIFAVLVISLGVIILFSFIYPPSLKFYPNPGACSMDGDDIVCTFSKGGNCCDFWETADNAYHMGAAYSTGSWPIDITQHIGYPSGLSVRAVLTSITNGPSYLYDERTVGYMTIPYSVAGEGYGFAPNTDFYVHATYDFDMYSDLCNCNVGSGGWVLVEGLFIIGDLGVQECIYDSDCGISGWVGEPYCGP